MLSAPTTIRAESAVTTLNVLPAVVRPLPALKAAVPVYWTKVILSVPITCALLVPDPVEEIENCW